METFDASDATWVAATAPPITHYFDGVDYFEVSPDGNLKPIARDTEALRLDEGCSVAFLLT